MTEFKCSRCNARHKMPETDIKTFTIPVIVNGRCLDKYATCPATNEPILFYKKELSYFDEMIEQMDKEVIDSLKKAADDDLNKTTNTTN